MSNFESLFENISLLKNKCIQIEDELSFLRDEVSNDLCNNKSNIRELITRLDNKKSSINLKLNDLLLKRDEILINGRIDSRRIKLIKNIKHPIKENKDLHTFLSTIETNDLRYISKYLTFYKREKTDFDIDLLNNLNISFKDTILQNNKVFYANDIIKFYGFIFKNKDNFKFNIPNLTSNKEKGKKVSYIISLYGIKFKKSTIRDKNNTTKHLHIKTIDKSWLDTLNKFIYLYNQ